MFNVWWINNIECNNELTSYDKDLARVLKEYFVECYFCENISFEKWFNRKAISQDTPELIKTDLEFFKLLLISCFIAGSRARS